MQVTKIFTFDAGHRLMHHKGLCQNLHGHTYKLEVTFKGDTDPTTGIVIDFKDIKKIINPLIEKFDHSMILNGDDKENIKHLSKMAYKIILMNGDPTVENMVLLFAKTINDSIPSDISISLYSVRLWETPTSYAEIKI